MGRIGQEQWLKPSEFPDGKFMLTATWAGATNPLSLDLNDHLNLINVKSISEVKRISSSTHFPPEPYFNTGRGPKPYGQYYSGLGSGSAVFELNSGEFRALSAIFTLDRTGHGSGSGHVNVRLVSWPVNTFKPDNTIDIGRMHMLPADVDIKLQIAVGSKIEKSTIITAKTGSIPVRSE